VSPLGIALGSLVAATLAFAGLFLTAPLMTGHPAIAHAHAHAPAGAPTPRVAAVLLPTAPVSASVQLVVRGTPGAQLLIDDELAGTLPVAIDLPPRAAPRSLLVSKRGFASVGQTIAGDRDAAVYIGLVRRQRGHFAPAEELKNPFSD